MFRLLPVALQGSARSQLVAGVPQVFVLQCLMQVELVATFAPQAEQPINYNVIVRVRNKPTPLQFNVKGEGYALSPSLLLELQDDSSLELSSSGVNTVDFGQVRRVESGAGKDTAGHCHVRCLSTLH